ncbi:uncharacterized protein RHOBADRAFT_54736 [Rhodotorula graminis WP1]|uniref:Uncharacterized protein n=1 Tax=Rhodotorula graminis (strain WP1) TaxID=578459 RepID=A0A0P9EJ36_RHOGW|nr:uncharacterized protein RHOBADRAFT_54736 [Rhodotorula graminis WP1]KPV73519.1 hypothetical protein RHOBADRAFT_54736 [Rhodotorula graminis WP1]
MPQLDHVFSQLAVHDKKGGPGGRVTHKSTNPARATTGDAQVDQPSTTTRLLSLFSRLCTPIRRSPTFNGDLQHVKSLLYNKEYLDAFGTDTDAGERWREVYMARWTPARAVMYERILAECAVAEALQWVEPPSHRQLSEEEELERERERARRRREARKAGKAVEELDDGDDATALAKGDVPEVLDVVMIGAGAGSEVVALGGVLGAALASSAASAQDGAKPFRRPRIAVHAADQGSWSTLLGKMEEQLRDEWPALEGDETAGGGFGVNFVRGDILAAASAPSSSSTSTDESAAPSTSPTAAAADALGLPFSSPSLRLITICFTITELLLQSRIATLRLLSSISRSAPSGTLLLIVESASLALIPLGKEGRTYPLGTLLDHALCGAQGDGAWDTVRGEDAKWYRMPDGADEVYNAGGQGAIVKLENSRVVLRLFKKK